MSVCVHAAFCRVVMENLRGIAPFRVCENSNVRHFSLDMWQTDVLDVRRRCMYVVIMFHLLAAGAFGPSILPAPR